MARLAANSTEFVEKVSGALLEALNADAGQGMVARLLAQSLEKNPGLTPDEWAQIKQGFFAFMFQQALKEQPELMAEYAGHIYRELRGEQQA